MDELPLLLERYHGIHEGDGEEGSESRRMGSHVREPEVDSGSRW